MSLNVANCPRCGRIFVKNPHGVCPACVKEIDLQYEACVKYLRDNRGCNIQELSDATEVPYRQIVKFIRDGRISIMNAPNMSYPCESCGTLIREGTICEPCRQRLSKDIRHVTEDDKRREEQEASKEQHTIYNIKDRLNNRNK